MICVLVYGGIGTVLKGQEGVARCIDEIKTDGGTILGTEITVEMNGVSVRVDVAADFNGKIILYEVKNVPYARFTVDQSEVYPNMIHLNESGVLEIPNNSAIIFRGQNAFQAHIAINDPTTNYYLVIRRY